MPPQYKKAKLNDISHIIQMLSNIYPISEKLAAACRVHAIQINLEPMDDVFYPGDICKYMYFIKTGAVMAYSPHDDKEIVTYISVENEFVSSLSGLYGESPTREGLRAIEPTTLLGVHTDILQKWYDEFFELNFIIRKVYENYYRDAQERSHVVRLGDAKERYLYFAKTRGEIVERLPVSVLASFLDMKTETLMRIKRQVVKEFTERDYEQLATKIHQTIVDLKLHCNPKLTVKDLAEKVSQAPSLVIKTIKRQTKRSFKDYLNKYKIEAFKAMLIDSDHLKNYTIVSLALQCGFASKSSFYHAYKKQEGSLPSNLL